MNAFTRGSQIFMHSLRMMGQGIKTAFTVSGMMVLGWLGVQCYRKLLWIDIYHWLFERWATLKLGIGSTFYNAKEITLSVYDFEDKIIKQFGALQYKSMLWQSRSGHRLINFGK